MAIFIPHVSLLKQTQNGQFCYLGSPCIVGSKDIGLEAKLGVYSYMGSPFAIAQTKAPMTIDTVPLTMKALAYLATPYNNQSNDVTGVYAYLGSPYITWRNT